MSRRSTDAIAAAAIDPGEGIVAILGKTEGNGNVNDFTRAFAVRALKDALRPHLARQAVERMSYVMSGGTEGGAGAAFAGARPRATAGEAALRRRSRSAARIRRRCRASDLGRLGQVRARRRGRRARPWRDAGIDDPADVHFVQIKCPLLTAERIAAAEARGASVATRDTLKSMGLSRGASALGVAVALGEIADRRASTTAAIGRDASLWSGRASASAGVELAQSRDRRARHERAPGPVRWRSTMR